MGIIYCWTNIQTNKKYIGKTIEGLDKRTKRHLTETIKKNYKFSKALKKYTKDDWVICVIEECDENLLSERECYWIDYYDTYKKGYNSTTGGEGSSGRIFSEKSKIKMRDSHKGKILSESHKKNISNSLKGNSHRKGIPHNENTRKKISDSSKGKKITEKTKQKISESLSKKLSVKKTFISPIGEVTDVVNLSGFCKENNLHPSKMRDVLNGKRNHHKGWTST
jgi:group I intron endonuclease